MVFEAGQQFVRVGPLAPTLVGYTYGILRSMTETPESTNEPQHESGLVRNDDRHEEPSRLVQVSAWTGIVAGVVVSIAAIFFSGFFLGWSSGSHYGWHRGHDAGMDHSCSMMGQGGMMPGGTMGPGRPMGPQQPPTSTAPSTPRP